jgi:hypothetical protein
MTERTSEVYRFFDVADEWWASKASNLKEPKLQYLKYYAMSDESKNTIIEVSFPFKDLHLWQKFVVDLKFNNRFTLTGEVNEFVEQIIKYAMHHKTVHLPRDTLLYRARINDISIDNDNDSFALDKMSAPPAHLAGHGRLNPKGIPYLYLASNRITAISEVRPWVGCDLTVAEFSLADDCNLVNFSIKHFVNKLESKQFVGSEITWRQFITWMFSAPFDPRDDTAYIPTQFLAERIKSAHFAGIIYDSALNADGYNVTLFDVKKANAVRREKARVTVVEIEAQFDSFAEDKG